MKILSASCILATVMVFPFVWAADDVLSSDQGDRLLTITQQCADAESEFQNCANRKCDSLAPCTECSQEESQCYATCAERKHCDIVLTNDSGPSYCTYAPDYSCYESGWPSCCLDDPTNCPTKPATCDVTSPPISPPTYCTWSPEYDCYKTGWPACCSGSDPEKNCPTQQPKCDVVSGESYCTNAPDYSCYYEGWPSCCLSTGPNCPREQPPCESNRSLRGGAF